MKIDYLEIAFGNKQAALFLESFVLKCHLMDDVVDKDKFLDDKRIARIEIVFLEQLLVNPWVRDNAVALWPHMVSGINAWLDANCWEKGKNSVLRQDAKVLKSQYHEMAWWVAYLCGGHDHMRAMSMKYREFDHEERN